MRKEEMEYICLEKKVYTVFIHRGQDCLCRKTKESKKNQTKSSGTK